MTSRQYSSPSPSSFGSIYLPGRLSLYLLAGLLWFSCRQASNPAAIPLTALQTYVAQPDTAFQWEVVQTIPAEDHDAYIIKMVSQRWMTTSEVEDPVWWHWLSVVVPHEVESSTGLMWIGGGSREREMPTEAPGLIVQAALATKTVAAEIHNIPNQPTVFVGDDYGPRVEDELIAYGWRQYLEGGAKSEDDIWLARLPMTKAVVRGMDVVSAFTGDQTSVRVDSFTVAGGSKRGWTTWTTAVVDDRVAAIVPVVIDMLNVIPSFQHHWRVYGFWAPAVDDYVQEGIMQWQGRPEYQSLVALTEPYSYREQLTMPKLLINATGDQFFLPDSWQFYWAGLKDEKHLRYVPNGDHSLRGTDAVESLIAFHHSVVNRSERPTFDWKATGDRIELTTGHPTPDSIFLWQASNGETRDFRVETIGRTWERQSIAIAEGGSYELSIEAPASGWSAFFGELVYLGDAGLPLKLTTGVVVVPDSVPYPPFVADGPPAVAQ